MSNARKIWQTKFKVFNKFKKKFQKKVQKYQQIKITIQNKKTFKILKKKFKKFGKKLKCLKSSK